MIRGLTCDYKVTVCAAKDLQQTKFMSRHDGVFDEKKDKAKSDVDPYVMIGKNTTVHFHEILFTFQSEPDVDEVFVERTTTKSKVRDPEWNETFSTDLLRSAEEIGFTVFHR